MSSQSPSLWRCLRRGFALRCPECGVSPIFVPLRKTRTLFDWFTPLDGCPRCGFAYTREEGYFLVAVWVLNYGIVTTLALAQGLWLQSRYHPALWSPIWLTLAWMPIASFALARHAKSIFIAVDHYFDPHVTTRHDAESNQRPYS
jgi:uncharacterized protein (DUF983 family)